MNRHLIPKLEFAALLEDTGVSGASKEKLWFTIADRILQDWNGVSYSYFDALTPGQNALVCCAELHRGAKHDFLTSITDSSLPSRALKAFETLRAREYSQLLQKVEQVFPKKQFPKYAEDVFSAVCKQPDNYFEDVGEKFSTGKGMKRPLHDYVFAYVVAHPEDFCGESFDPPLKLGENVAVALPRPSPNRESVQSKEKDIRSKAPRISPRHGRVKSDLRRMKSGGDQFAVIRSAHTSAPNFGLDTDAIVARLTAWQSQCSFSVTGAEGDSVDIKFVTLPRDMDAFARDLYEFCPDLVDQGTGCLHEFIDAADESGEALTPEIKEMIKGVDFSDENYGLEILKRELQQKKSVTLWWD